MQSTMAFALRGEGSSTLEIDVYDTIGQTFFGEGVSAKDVLEKLKANPNAKTIKLRVNSRGGDVMDGFAIYNMLNEHPARVEVDVDALAASIASVIIMAADEVRMAENAMLMIHNAWSLAVGDAAAMRERADVLDKLSGQIATAYTARTGLSEARIREMMNAETWLTAAEAKDQGFADVVKPAKKGAAKAKALASLDLDGLSAVPQHFMAAVAQARAAVQPKTNEGAQRAEEIDMSEAQFLATLGVASLALAQSRLAFANSIEAAVGATGDEAHGRVLAGVQALNELPKAQARIAELEHAQAGAELDKLIATAKDEKKLTPALEKTVREQFAAKALTIGTVTAMFAALPTIPAFATREPSQPVVNGQGELTWNGKTYAELKPAQRAELAKENPDLFAAMRSASEQG